jgi:hypothetical protein
VALLSGVEKRCADPPLVLGEPVSVGIQKRPTIDPSRRTGKTHACSKASPRARRTRQRIVESYPKYIRTSPEAWPAPRLRRATTPTERTARPRRIFPASSWRAAVGGVNWKASLALPRSQEYRGLPLRSVQGLLQMKSENRDQKCGGDPLKDTKPYQACCSVL